MLQRLQRSLDRLRDKRARGDKGLTLIELLVVIVILGILAAIIIISLAGLGDKGKAAASSTDSDTIRTAEEAYCNANGSYGDTNTLRGLTVTSGKTVSTATSYLDFSTGATGTNFLAKSPKYNGAVVYPGTTCGATNYTVGPASTSGTSGALIYSASNNTAADSFLSQEFSANNAPVQFNFNASGGLATLAKTAGNQAALYLPADTANAAGLANTALTATNPAFNGTCTGSAITALCPADAAPVQYAQGRLVAFSCRANGTTLQPASGASPQCKSGTGGYFGSGGAISVSGGNAAPTSVADVAAVLAACGSCKLAIANPGTATIAGITGPCPSVTTCAPAAAATAPYGFAAFEALLAPTASGGGGLTRTQYDGYVTSGQIVYGTNVTDTQSKVEGGTVDMALLPRSFVISPEGVDSNSWYLVGPADSSTTGTALNSPIIQSAVVLVFGRNAYDVGVARAFLAYLLSTEGKAVLTAHGYV